MADQELRKQDRDSATAQFAGQQMLSESDTDTADGLKQHAKPESDDGLAKKESKGKEDGEVVYPTGIRLWLIMFAITMTFFLLMMDQTIMATATPVITNEFHSLVDIGWYAAAYQLSSAVLQPLFGKIYHYFSTKWVFIAAVVTFSVASLICALAPNSGALIAGRTIAGVGASAIYNGGILMLASIAPLEKRASLMGILIGIAQLGLVGGPLIGGAFTEYVTWRWCFYINLPLTGLSLAALLVNKIPDQVPKQPVHIVLRDKALWRKLDLIGEAIFAPSVIMLLLALQWGGNKLPWNSATIVGLLVGAVAVFVLFLCWEKFGAGDDNAMLPLAMATHRIVFACFLNGSFVFISIILASFFLPVYFQSVKAATPFQSGVYLLPSMIGQIIFAVSTGLLIGKIGYYLPFSVAGAMFITIGAGLFSTFSPTTSTGRWIGFQVVHAAGRGMSIQQSLLAVQAAVPPSQLAVSTAFIIFGQNIAGATFITVGNTLFDNSLRDQLFATGLFDAEKVAQIIAAGATAFRTLLPDEQVAPVVLSYTRSIDRVFYLAVAVGGLLFLSSFFIGWKKIEKKKVPAPAPAVEGAEVEEKV